jgi:hypothetical protein
MSEQIFPEGMRLWPPHERAPQFIKGNLSVHLATFTEWAQQHLDAKGFVKLDLKEGRDAKLYLALNTWKKDDARSDTQHGTHQEEAPTADINPDDIPF